MLLSAAQEEVRRVGGEGKKKAGGTERTFNPVHTCVTRTFSFHSPSGGVAQTTANAPNTRNSCPRENINYREQCTLLFTILSSLLRLACSNTFYTRLCHIRFLQFRKKLASPRSSNMRTTRCHFLYGNGGIKLYT